MINKTLTKDEIAALKWERRNKMQTIINYALALAFSIPVVGFKYFAAQGKSQLRSSDTSYVSRIEYQISQN